MYIERSIAFSTMLSYLHRCEGKVIECSVDCMFSAFVTLVLNGLHLINRRRRIVSKRSELENIRVYVPVLRFKNCISHNLACLIMSKQVLN